VIGGGLLGGHGIFNADVIIKNGGVFSPGNSIGTTTIAGDWTLESGAVYEVEVDTDNPGDGTLSDPGVSDLTVVTGAASLSGTLRVLASGAGKEISDYTGGKQWLILDALTALTGTFDRAYSDLAFLVPELYYDDVNFDVWLSFIQKASFGSYAETFNQRSAAAALESLGTESSLFNTVVTGTAEHEVRGLLDSLSAEIHATVLGSLFSAGTDFWGSLAGRASRISRGEEDFRRGEAASAGAGDYTSLNGFWMSAGASYGVLKDNGNAGRAEIRGRELSLGYQRAFTDGWFGGLAFMYSSKRLEVASRSSKADVDSFYLALYGGKEFRAGPGALRLLLAGVFGRHEVSAERRAVVGSDQQILSSSYDADSQLVFFEVAYRRHLSKRTILEPFLSEGRNNIVADSFAESGGTAALRVGKERWSDASSAAGLRAKFKASERLSFSLEAGWRHVYGKTVPRSVMAFHEGGGDLSRQRRRFEPGRGGAGGGSRLSRVGKREPRAQLPGKFRPPGRKPRGGSDLHG
jgi:outer membrane autotransporter protein